MKTNLLMTIGAAALAAITFNATASSALLSPRALGNQIKILSGVANDSNLVAADQGLAIAPRAAGNQSTKVAGTSTEVTPASVCVKSMAGSPKAIQACTDQPGKMPVCNSTSVAVLK
jgi:hypothetical protein